MDGNSSDVEKFPIKIEEITMNKHTIEEDVKEEIVSAEETSIQHNLYSTLNYSDIIDLNPQEGRLPIDICIKQEHDCVNQDKLGIVTVKKEDKSEDEGWQKNEEQETKKLTGKPDIENSIFKKFKSEKFANCDIFFDENKLDKVKCEVLEPSEIIIKTEHRGNNQTLECESCDYGIEYEQAVTRQHGNVEICALCAHTTKWKKKLTQHTKTKHDMNSKTLKCGFCEYTTKYRSCLHEHIKIKHDENCEILECTLCEFTTKLKSHLTQHIKLKHNLNREIFKCKLCKFTTREKGCLNNHMKGKHDENCEILKCGLCELTTKYKRALVKHIKRKHYLDSETFKCKFCEFTTRDKYYLTRHTKVKHDENSEILKCALCEFATKAKCYMKKHMKWIHDE